MEYQKTLRARSRVAKFATIKATTLKCALILASQNVSQDDNRFTLPLNSGKFI